MYAEVPSLFLEQICGLVLENVQKRWLMKHINLQVWFLVNYAMTLLGKRPLFQIVISYQQKTVFIVILSFIELLLCPLDYSSNS